MAKKTNVYKKYRVYFFLYLAVICELLIVIVERDDAEESLLIKQAELEKKNRAIILELLKNMPAVAAAGDNQLKVNESRNFTIRVKGLGEHDEVTTPPIVHVYNKDQVEVQTIQYSPLTLDAPNYDFYAIHDSTLQSTTGERLYRFNWKADKGAGQFEFHVEAGTNRIELKPELEKGATVKVGTLDFKREEIQSAIDGDPRLRGTPIDFFIRKSENLDPAKFVVDVISEAYEQFTIRANDLVTAVGYESTNGLIIEGTTPDRVTRIDPLGGGNCSRTQTGVWIWTGRIDEPGAKEISLSGSDNRGAGSLSIAKSKPFKVVVKQPYLRKKKPRNAYAGETFVMNIDVYGLERVNEYSWKLEIDEQTVLDSVGPNVRYFISDAMVGKQMVIRSLYNGRPYSWQDSTATSTELKPSEFTYKISPTVDNVYALFEQDATYPQGFEFAFEAYRCGTCIKVNEKAIPANEISVDAMKASGGSLSVDWVPVPIIEGGKEKSTKVTFRIKGRVSKNGEVVRIKMTAGTATEEVDIKLKGS